MTEKLTSPIDEPKIAAQEMLALLVQAGAFTPSGALLSTSAGQNAASAMIATHKALTTYYATLSKQP